MCGGRNPNLDGPQDPSDSDPGDPRLADGSRGVFDGCLTHFEDGSHQFRVREGDTESRRPPDGEPGGELIFDKVLLIAGEGEPTIGAPSGRGPRGRQIVRQFRDKKIVIQKFRRRKNMRRSRGHRQPYTTVQITEHRRRPDRPACRSVKDKTADGRVSPRERFFARLPGCEPFHSPGNLVGESSPPLSEALIMSTPAPGSLVSL